MGILDRARNFISRAVSPVRPEQRSEATATKSPVFGNSGGTRAIGPENVMTLIAARACIQKIAQTVASLSVDVFSVDGDKQNKIDHEISYFLKRKPSENLTAFDFWEEIISDSLIYPAGYAAIVRDKNGKITGLKLLPAKEVRQSSMHDDLTLFVCGNDAYFEHELIIIKNFKSLSNASTHSDALTLYKSAEDFGRSFFKNGGNVSGVITTDHQLDDNQYNRLKLAWHSRNHGANASHSTAILENGMKYEKIGTNPESSQLSTTRKFQTEDVCRIFGVPPALVGLDTNVTFSNVEQQSIFFATYTITPLLRKLEQELCIKLLKDSEQSSTEIKFNISTLLRADAKTRGEYYSALIRDGIVSINEAREALENLNPVEGGDTHFVQVNLAPLDKVKKGIQPTKDIKK